MKPFFLYWRDATDRRYWCVVTEGGDFRAVVDDFGDLLRVG